MITEIKNQTDINEAIEALGQSKIVQKQNLTEGFEQKMQSLNPATLIKSAVGQATINPSLKKSVLYAAAGVAAVMVLKKMTNKRSGGKGLLFMALSGVGTMLVKKMMAKRITQ